MKPLPPIIGIDISKEKSNLVCIDAHNQITKQFEFLHTYDGLKTTLHKVQNLERQLKASPIIVMEATGHYHRFVFYLFFNAGFKVAVLNPLTTKAVRNLAHIRKIKTDVKDAYTIALAYRLKETTPTNIPSETRQTLQTLCRDYWDLSHQICRWRSKLRAIRDQTFLLFDKAFKNSFSNTALQIFLSYPTPKHILREEKTNLVEKLQRLSRKGKTWAERTADKLIHLSTQSPSLYRVSDLQRIQSYVRIIAMLKQEAKQLRKEIVRIATTDPQWSLLCSIPGIGPIIAATVLAEIGNLSWFRSPPKVVAYAGVDPSIFQSGKFKGTKMRMSKRGSKYLRYAIYLAAASAIKKTVNGRIRNPVLRDYYQQKVTKGKKKGTALGACMHKMIFYIYATLRDNRPFVIRSREEHLAQWRANRDLPERSLAT